MNSHLLPPPPTILCSTDPIGEVYQVLMAEGGPQGGKGPILDIPLTKDLMGTTILEAPHNKKGVALPWALLAIGEQKVESTMRRGITEVREAQS